MKPAPRRDTHTVSVRGIPIGGGAPVVVQSMTNTDTADAESTAAQVLELHRAGSELVRITVNTREAAAAVPEIRRRLEDAGADVPLIGDFHYNGHVLLAEFPDCAETLDKYRINPGNVGKGAKHDTNFATMIGIARDRGRPIRIGVNAGSLDQEVLARLMDENARASASKGANEVLLDAMVESAVASVAAARELGLPETSITVSAKISKVQELVAVYRMLSERTRQPLHLGLTEAGMGNKGVIASTAGIAILLQEGIGDTIRVSLTPRPGGARTEEVKVAQGILQALDLRSFSPEVTACPGCGRTTSSFFQELAEDIEGFLSARMPVWRQTVPEAADLKVAVMGCVVNGPGESKAAHIGISLPGTGEAPRSPVFIDGEHHCTLEGPGLAEDFKQLVEDYVSRMGSSV